MPVWVSDLLQSDRLLTVVFVFFIVGMVVKSALKAWPFLSKFVGLVHTLVGDDDNPGIGDRMDEQGGKLTEISGVVEKVRAQVENSHKSNFREDLDANTEATHSALRKIEQLTEKLEEHIRNN